MQQAIKIEGVRVANGDAVLYVNSAPIVTREATEIGEDPMAVGERLAKELGVPMQTFDMPVPADEEWTWLDLYELLPPPVLPEYRVSVTRTSYRSCFINVNVRTPEQAGEEALRRAGDHEFAGEHDADYAVDFVEIVSTAEEEMLAGLRIHAEVHSDDRVFDGIIFDATSWFAEASDKAIVALHGIDWGGDQESDVVAEFYEPAVPDIAELLSYCRRTQNTERATGFECHVNHKEAMAWLKHHRAGLWAQLLCADLDVDLVEAQEEEIRGRWDWLSNLGSASESSFATIGEAALNAVEVLKLGGGDVTH